jgi:hypothetical protein
MSENEKIFLTNIVHYINGKHTKVGEKAVFWCPGCQDHHFLNISGGEPVWTWNGSYIKPTFNPSLRVRYGSHGSKVCHLFLTEGRIQFLSDCTHGLRGKTVKMIDSDINKKEFLG